MTYQGGLGRAQLIRCLPGFGAKRDGEGHAGQWLASGLGVGRAYEREEEGLGKGKTRREAWVWPPLDGAPTFSKPSGTQGTRGLSSSTVILGCLSLNHHHFGGALSVHVCEVWCARHLLQYVFK